MSTKYPHVFQPIQIGPVSVRNRIYIPPHGLSLQTGGAHGTRMPSDRWAQYFAERAAGGVGLIIHSLSVHRRSVTPFYEESIPAFHAVAELVHREGAKIFAQLHYADRHTGPWDGNGGMAPPLSVTERQLLFWGGRSSFSVREMDHIDIKMVVEDYARCARNLAQAGYDGIEIHTTHGMLHEQFLSPYFNQRTDEYGGDETGRMRFLVETLQALRAAGGPNMAIGLRLNVDERIPEGLTSDDTQRVLGRLIDGGLIDFADLDAAMEPQQQHYMTMSFLRPPLQIAGFVAKVRSVGKGRIPMMGNGGRVTTVAQAEKLLADDSMDMVGVVRQLLAEPEWLKNAMEGHEERSRICIAHNFCIGRVGDPTLGCIINPATTREGRWGVRTFVPAPATRSVVVVGGGPAGLEAARVAAMRGHQVTVFEGRDRVGGQLNLWAAAPQREVLRTTVDWYKGRLAELGVRVRTNTTATAATILAERPDVAIIAAGSRYDATGRSAFAHGPIRGADQSFVYTPERILEEGARPTGRVLILDEQRDHAGPAIAQLLAAAGAKVEILSSAPDVLGEWIYYGTTHKDLIPILHRLGVVLTPHHYVRSIEQGNATVFHALAGEEQVRPVDAVVLLTMRTAQGRALERALEDKIGHVYSIGDAAAPRGLYEAVYDGQRFARLIGEPNAPRTTREAIFSDVPDDVLERPAATLLDPPPGDWVTAGPIRVGRPPAVVAGPADH